MEVLRAGCAGLTLRTACRVALFQRTIRAAGACNRTVGGKSGQKKSRRLPLHPTCHHPGPTASTSQETARCGP